MTSSHNEFSPEEKYTGTSLQFLQSIDNLHTVCTRLLLLRSNLTGMSPEVYAAKLETFKPEIARLEREKENSELILKNFVKDNASNPALINAKSKNRHTALSVAVQFLLYPLTDAITKIPGAINVPDGRGATPLMLACDGSFTHYHNINMVKQLLSVPDIDLNVKDNISRLTALNIAIIGKHAEVVKLLVAKGAEMEPISPKLLSNYLIEAEHEGGGSPAAMLKIQDILRGLGIKSQQEVSYSEFQSLIESEFEPATAEEYANAINELGEVAKAPMELSLSDLSERDKKNILIVQNYIKTNENLPEKEKLKLFWYPEKLKDNSKTPHQVITFLGIDHLTQLFLASTRKPIVNYQVELSNSDKPNTRRDSGASESDYLGTPEPSVGAEAKLLVRRNSYSSEDRGYLGTPERPDNESPTKPQASRYSVSSEEGDFRQALTYSRSNSGVADHPNSLWTETKSTPQNAVSPAPQAQNTTPRKGGKN